MSTLVDRLRLRDGRPDGFGIGKLCDEAAAEIDRLTDLVEANAKAAARWRWYRAHFATDHRAAGLHACETPERLEAWVDRAIAEMAAQSAQEPAPARYTLNGVELTAKSGTVVVDGPTSFVSRHRY